MLEPDRVIIINLPRKLLGFAPNTIDGRISGYPVNPCLKRRTKLEVFEIFILIGIVLLLTGLIVGLFGGFINEVEEGNILRDIMNFFYIGWFNKIIWGILIIVASYVTKRYIPEDD